MREHHLDEPRHPDEVQRMCEAFEQALLDRRIRRTTQRLAIYRAVAILGHPTADAVFEQIRALLPGLSMATVYRVLDELSRAGLIRKVGAAQGGAVRFDANTRAHQHLICRSCGEMTDLHDAELSGIDLSPHVTRSFVAEHLDIRVVGLCASCHPELTSSHAVT